MDIERLRPSLEIETPSLMAGGHLPLASVLFVNAALTRGFEVLAKIF
jgi:hypothetical protein